MFVLFPFSVGSQEFCHSLPVFGIMSVVNRYFFKYSNKSEIKIKDCLFIFFFYHFEKIRVGIRSRRWI